MSCRHCSRQVPRAWLFFLLAAAGSTRSVSALVRCSVIAYGAVGDNITEDTAAIQRTIDATSPATGAPLCDVVVIPAGSVFLSRPIFMTSMSNRTLSIEGTLSLWRNISSWDPGFPYMRPFIGPERAQNSWTLYNFTITGGGTIEGGGFRWWYAGLHDARPMLIGLPLVSHFHLHNLTLLDSPFWNTGIRGDHILIEDMTVVALGESCRGWASAPNTDGFNVGGQHIVVRNSRVHNGDDCVPVTTPGIAAAPDTFDVLVDNVTCACGTNGGVVYNTGGSIRDVTFSRLVVNGTDNGGSIKIGRATNNATGGTVTNVSWTDYLVLSPRQQGLYVNVFAEGGCSPPADPNRTDWLQVTDIHWANYTVSGASPAQPAAGHRHTLGVARAARGLLPVHARSALHRAGPRRRARARCGALRLLQRARAGRGPRDQPRPVCGAGRVSSRIMMWAALNEAAHA